MNFFEQISDAVRKAVATNPVNPLAELPVATLQISDCKLVLKSKVAKICFVHNSKRFSMDVALS